MAAPKTTTIRLKLRTTGEEVDAEIKLLSATQFAMLFRKLGIKTANELMRLKDLGDLKIIELSETLSAEALSVNERWTVNDVRNAFDIAEILKIVDTVNQSLPQAPKGEAQTQKQTPYH
jgi:hypothetical protein